MLILTVGHKIFKISDNALTKPFGEVITGMIPVDSTGYGKETEYFRIKEETNISIEIKQKRLFTSIEELDLYREKESESND